MTDKTIIIKLFGILNKMRIANVFLKHMFKYVNCDLDEMTSFDD